MIVFIFSAPERGFQKKDQSYTYNLRLNNDPTAFQNFVLYWHTHYEDYEWDESKLVFVNKRTAKETTTNSKQQQQQQQQQK